MLVPIQHAILFPNIMFYSQYINTLSKQKAHIKIVCIETGHISRYFDRYSCCELTVHNIKHSRKNSFK